MPRPPIVGVPTGGCHSWLKAPLLAGVIGDKSVAKIVKGEACIRPIIWQNTEKLVYKMLLDRLFPHREATAPQPQLPCRALFNYHDCVPEDCE